MAESIFFLSQLVNPLLTLKGIITKPLEAFLTFWDQLWFWEPAGLRSAGSHLFAFVGVQNPFWGFSLSFFLHEGATAAAGVFRVVVKLL